MTYADRPARHQRLLRPDIARNRFESMEAAFSTVPSGIFQVDRIVRPVQDIPDFVRSTRQRSCAGSARRRSKPEMYGSGSGGFRYLPARKPTLVVSNMNICVSNINEQFHHRLRPRPGRVMQKCLSLIIFRIDILPYLFC